jgi:chromosome segregation ATPase
VYILEDVIISPLSDVAKQHAYNEEHREKLRLRLRKAENDCLKSHHHIPGLYDTIDTTALFRWFRQNIASYVMPYFEASDSHKKELARNRLEEAIYSIALAVSDDEKKTARNCLETLLDAVKEHLLDGQTDISLVLAALEESQNRLMACMKQTVEYKDSFAEMIDDMSPRAPNKMDFHYLNPLIGFYGRSEESKQINAFLKDERPLCFSVITGPAGAGKSKFVYHYINPDANGTNPEARKPVRE